MGRKNKNKRMKKKQALTTITNGDATSAAAKSNGGIPEDTPEPSATVSLQVVQQSPPAASQTRLVLTEGRKDLKNAQPPFECLWDPLRRIVLDPSMAVASIVVPGVVEKVPAIDTLAATSIKIPFSLVKFGYGLLPFRGDHQEIDLLQVAANDILATTTAGSSPVPTIPLGAVSLPELVKVLAALGISVVADVAGAVLNPNKAVAWMVSLWQTFRFLDSSQLDGDLQKAVVTPLYSGRLIDNINIFRIIQDSPLALHHKVKRYRRSQVQQAINDGSRFMKYATAAYGTGMIQASLNGDDNISSQQMEKVKSAIAKHCGIKKSDIKKLCVSEGGNVKLLRHFIAVDRKSRNVVLAIRGTLSVSGALIDLQANDADFCGGKAHRGMSEMAVNLWNAAGETIQELLAQLNGANDGSSTPWGLVLVGHSLGAGTATLLNLLIHTNHLVGTNRVVKCFGFASPPVFCVSDESSTRQDSVTAHAIDKAIKNTTCFIHGEDCVPFLSVVSVAKSAAQLETVDDSTKTMSPLERMAVASKKKPVPQELSDAVHQVQQPIVPGASRLTIPAEKVVWMYSSSSSDDGAHAQAQGSYDVMGCLADELANLNIYVSANMITNHMPKGYEDSLDALAK